VVYEIDLSLDQEVLLQATPRLLANQSYDDKKTKEQEPLLSL
jgi:hypothetical protein